MIKKILSGSSPENSLDFILDQIKETYGQIPNKRYNASVRLTAGEIRRGYVMGMIDANTVKRFDLHNLKAIEILYRMNFKTIEVITITEEQ